MYCIVLCIVFLANIVPNDRGAAVLGSVHSLPVGRLVALAEDWRYG